MDVCLQKKPESPIRGFKDKNLDLMFGVVLEIKS